MEADGVRGRAGGRGGPGAGPGMAPGAGTVPGRRGRGGRPGASPRVLGRAIRYISHYQRLALFAYGSLFVATAAQLVVPQLVQNIIDEVVKAYIATQVLAQPAPIQILAAQRMG